MQGKDESPQEDVAETPVLAEAPAGIPVGNLTSKYERIIGRMSSQVVEAELQVEMLQAEFEAKLGEVTAQRDEAIAGMKKLAARIEALEEIAHPEAAPTKKAPAKKRRA